VLKTKTHFPQVPLEIVKKIAEKENGEIIKQDRPEQLRWPTKKRTNDNVSMKKNYIEYPWQQTVVDAFLASPADLAGKIYVAERAIMARLKAPEKISPAEHSALEDALRSLRILVADLKSQGNAEPDGHKDKKRFC